MKPGGKIDENYSKEDAWFVHLDATGNFLNAKVMGSTGYDAGHFVVPLSNSFVMAGGIYSANVGTFSNYQYSGINSDAFAITFAPWSTDVENVELGQLVMIYPNPADKYVVVETKY